MQFLLVLLLCAQSVVSTLTPDISPDPSRRGLGATASADLPSSGSTDHPDLVSGDIQNYTAVANLAEDVQKTEEFLKSKVRPGIEIRYLREGGKVVGWWRLALDFESFETVKSYKGIKAIRLSSLRVVNDLPLETRDAELNRRDVQFCSCLVKNTSDVQEVESFLKSKIQSGSKYYPYRRKDKVLGWYHLMLDSDAQKTVKEYDGVEYFKVGVTKLTKYRSLPATGPSLLPSKMDTTLGKKSALLPRAEEWVKQTTEDKALKMDSQYP